MSVSKLPSVETLVNRIKIKNKGHHKIISDQISYHSPVKQLQDQQIGDMPILVWDNQNNPYQANKQQQALSDNNFHNKDVHQNQLKKQTIRNLGYCNLQRDIPRVPHRKHEGDLMKTLIYNAHYRDHPLNQPLPLNYDYQYTQHQKKYQQLQSQTTNFYRKKSKSVIGPKVEKDRLSSKKYPKIMN